MKNIRLIAALTAAAAAAVPFSAYGVSAADNTGLAADAAGTFPDWVPADLESAVSFRNEFGATHIADGYLCVVFREEVERSSDGTPVSSYRYDVRETEGIMEKVSQTAYTSEFGDYRYEAVLYHVTEATGDFEVALADTYIDAAEPLIPEGLEHIAAAHYTFTIDENHDIHETDIYSWLPDSDEEYRKYYDEHGKVSVKDNYVVFCLKSSAGTMYRWELDSMEGENSLGFVGDYFCSMETVAPVAGGSMNTIALYQGVSDGYAKVNYVLAPGYGMPSGPDTVIDTASVDCAVYDDGASVVKAGDIKVTLVDADTGEKIPVDKDSGECVMLATDISFYDPELGGYISTGPIYEIEENPCYINIGMIFSADSYYFGLVEYSLPEGYYSDARYANGKSYPEDGIEVRRFDNGSADVVFKLKYMISGDVNGDKEFGIADLVTLQKFVVSGSSTDLTNWKAGDFNGNYRLDIYDLLQLRRKLFRPQTS